MESKATGRYIPQKSKKRVFPGSSSCMESKRMNKMSNQNEDGMVMISSRTNGAEEHHMINKIHSSKEVQSHKKGKGVVSSALGVIEVDSDSDDSVADSYIKKNYMDFYSGDYIYGDDDEYAILQSHFDNIDLPTGIEASLPGFFDCIKRKSKIPSTEPDKGKQPRVELQRDAIKPRSVKKLLEAIDVPGNGEIVRLEDVKLDQDHGVAESSSSMRQLGNGDRKFKKFDIVKDHEDHHFAGNSSMMEPPRNWAKKIQEEWRILKNNLPDTIFVRVYESRMDLLTAVIIGAEGTPYHDGLFFFDVYFPRNYPDAPPDVYYHSGGLRINPNLYASGKVCLSLLNTWIGRNNERWIPGASTMLQVLVSIQGLILNTKPYFNEPGYAHSSGSVDGEKHSAEYNERMLVLSLKTMVYTMKKPPKHFEDLVIEHFRGRAHAILMTCKAYSEGVRVGCAIDKGKAGEEEGCSWRFKRDVVECMKILVGGFKQIGVEDIEKLLEEVGIEGLMASTSLTQKIRAFFGI